MTVNLAGFNVDIENINCLKKILEKDNISVEDAENLKKLNWTPETISASYARISRDPRNIDELREEARNEVEKARKSNNAIIFTMGHSSIAEHAVFNLDIVNISRFLSEEIEKSRLASFTEKSQRYIKIGEDIYIPEEFRSDRSILDEYKEIMKDLFSAYQTVHDKLVPYFKEIYPVSDEKSTAYRDVVNLAKEDARYLLPLSILTQVGVTANARTYEKLIRKLFASELIEARVLGENIYNQIRNYSPSLIKYTNPTPFETNTYKEIKDALGIFKDNIMREEKDVELLNYDKDFEDNLVAIFLQKNSVLSFSQSKRVLESMSFEEKEKIIGLSIKYLSSYDSMLREYETGEFEFNILLSATAFAQLKRHRMATLIDGEYSPELGVTVPQSVIDVGLKGFYLEKMDKVERFYYKIKDKYYKASKYVLTNGHRKNVYFKCNFRELVHICRLRMDKHSQWDIRNIATLMANSVSDKYKIVGKLLKGKDSFNSGS